MVVRDDEVIESNGLLVRAEGFGAGEVVGYVAGEWDLVQDDYGSPVNWTDSPIVVGPIVLHKIVSQEFDDGTETRHREVNLYCIEDQISGQRKAIFGNYQLDVALEGRVAVGHTWYIEWRGKRENGPRSLNTYVIARKKS